MKNKQVNYEIELKSSGLCVLKVIEERITTLKTSGKSIIARKIKTQFGEFWLREGDFNLLFQKKK